MTIKKKTTKKQSKSTIGAVLLDINKAQDREVLGEMSKNEIRNWTLEHCNFPALLNESKQSCLRLGKNQLFVHPDYKSRTFILSENNELSYCDHPITCCCDKAFDFTPNDNEAVKLPEQNKLVINGDEADLAMCETINDIVFGDKLIDPKSYTTISFECLRNFYDGKTTLAHIWKFLGNGRLRLVDSTQDEVLPISKRELVKIRERIKLAKKKTDVKINPPQPGFTFVKNKWHRAAFALLKDTQTDMYILMGQDEGSYFGVELPKTAETIDQAMDILIPDDAKGKKYTRQGEWFFIQVAEAIVPKLLDRTFTFEHTSGYLPLETEDSNRHEVFADEIVFAKTGEAYMRNPQVEHDQHNMLNLSGWYICRRNTAVRSFSQEGVD